MWKFLVAFCLLCCVETDASNLLDSDKLTDAVNLTLTDISNPLDSEECCLKYASNLKKIAEEIKDTDKVLYTAYQKIIKRSEEMAEVNKALAKQDKALAEKDKALAEKDKALAEKDKVLAEQDKENLLLKEENESLKAQIAKLKKPS
jgi:uncharacterized protein (DUF3084 family)